jgi:hypothetical protein
VFVPNRQSTALITGIERRKCERVFLDLLENLTSVGQPVSPNNRAGNYAPRLFHLRPDREGYSRADFERSMHSLFAKKAIVNVEYGRSGDRRSRIVRVAQEAST